MIAEPGAADKSRANIRAKVVETKKRALPVYADKARRIRTTGMYRRNYGFGAAVAGAGRGAGLGAGVAAPVFTG